MSPWLYRESRALEAQAAPEYVPFAALCPGERFTREGVPNVVYAKASHTWANGLWKGRVLNLPMHPTDRVRRAPVAQRNPGEPQCQ
jgi:hypothetical protein